jgi:GNAT superfamily N-acetyltransferase
MPIALYLLFMFVRQACEADAVAAANVVERSITEFCKADYRDDPVILTRWLENRSAEHMRLWMQHPDRYLAVVEAGQGRLLGVGLATSRGTIELNYVEPEARFRGVSKLLVQNMEAHLRLAGCTSVSLVSTSAAQGFYAGLGYQEHGLEESSFGTLPGVRMVKSLNPEKVR